MKVSPSCYVEVLQASVAIVEGDPAVESLVTETRGTHATLAMSGSAALARRAQAVDAQQPAQRFATERKAFAL
jgi:hypothetical protein